MFKENKKGGKKSVFIYGTIDERTKSIVYQGDAYMGRFLLFAILLDVVYRGLRYDDPMWELLLIVIIGGGISTFYQIKNKILVNNPNFRKSLFLLIVISLISAAVTFLVVFILNHK
ncbi:hypothetical protein A2V47_00970 [Candidatus Atribacteria bacterium RBG_19FT_COMBO_35_14]|uniref:Uncharacterized protein n=1 Tax=Candidatus Sediminicultor quintus TaxID=1797291 RepID=A0A1F5ACY6_9BACT|nr:MAG: hypothetical protein A2V47_00970 [Candidatus Atribacteria bacterium RBG_19FT_COMBO_35_14]